MEEEVRTVVRIAAQPIADALREKLRLKENLESVRVEADVIVFEFRRHLEIDADLFSRAVISAEQTARRSLPTLRIPPVEVGSTAKRQRRAAKRNRMRTKGWPVVGKIETSRGQTAMIYEPLVKALTARPHSPTEQRAIVGRLLRENGNDPTESSIEYYLQSTLEYLQQQKESKK